LSAPAVAWNADGRLICEGIEAQRPGAYGSVDGIRTAARNRKAARAAVRKADEKVNAMDEAALATALAAIPTPPGPIVEPGAVVAGQFGGTLDRTARPDAPTGSVTVSPAQWADFLRNYDRAVGMAPARKATGGAGQRHAGHSPRVQPFMAERRRPWQNI
jgi:putative transposase